MLFTACAEEPPPEPVRPVRSIVVGNAGDFEGRWWPGRARATLEVDLGFEVSGRLIERQVNVGDEVPAGVVMAQLDARDFENALRRAKAERDRARAMLGRVEEAAKTNAVSRQEVDDARARYNQSDAQVAIRQKAVDDTHIVAPFDGVVSRTYVDNFQNVRPKQPVIRFLDVSAIEMVINIPEDRINNVQYVRDVKVRFDALPGAEISARIKEIGNEASLATRTFPVTLIMDPAGQGLEVKPGMAGEATGRIERPEARPENTFELPASALFSPDGGESEKTFVWIVDPETSRVQRREVTPGEITLRGGTRVQGLEPNDRVVTAGVHWLHEGQQVRTQ